jgi:3',5'-cyclic AMP phosphodiesterase CpdA
MLCGVRILHLSDFHLEQADRPNADGIDPRGALRQMLADCARLDPIDLVVVSGDIADDGSPEAYADAARIVAGFARAAGAPQIYCVGNHDQRPGFTEVLGSGHVGVDGGDRGTLAGSAEGERAAASEVGGYRVVTLDALVPGKGFGSISDSQLEWLAGVLATPAQLGTVLVMHYPPIALDRAGQQSLMLQNAAALRDAIEGSDVRVVLCGHFHHQMTGRLGETPVVVTPGVVNRIDLTTSSDTERAVFGASATVVELDGPHAPLSYVLHARDPRVGRTAYELDADELAALIADLGPPPP